MRIVATTTGVINHDLQVEWPPDWPVPRVGDEVEIPGLPEATHVRVVQWLPHGDPEHDTPYVYVVLGPPRR